MGAISNADLSAAGEAGLVTAFTSHRYHRVRRAETNTGRSLETDAPRVLLELEADTMPGQALFSMSAQDALSLAHGLRQAAAALLNEEQRK